MGLPSCTCPYPAIFTPLPPATHALQKFSQIPVPYVIEAPLWGTTPLAPGDTLAFHMVVIGRALRELPLIILAWRRALARGLGAGDGTAELVRVVHRAADGGDIEIHRPEIGNIAPHEQALYPHTGDGPEPSHATLHFATPLRLQQNGHASPPEKLDARTLLTALVRRASLLAEFHADGPLLTDFAALHAGCAGIRDDKHLVWRDWTRYSSRQETETGWRRRHLVARRQAGLIHAFPAPGRMAACRQGGVFRFGWIHPWREYSRRHPGRS